MPGHGAGPGSHCLQGALLAAMNRSLRRQIPSFSLYGEHSRWTGQTDPLHVESIQSRSSKYLWKIGSHRHIGLCQCVYVAAGPVEVDLEGSPEALQGPVVFIIPAGTVHGFVFGSDSNGYVLTMDLEALLCMVNPAHQGLIAALFSIPRTLDLASDPMLAARSSELFDILMREFQQPDSHTAPLSGWLGCSVLWALAASPLPVPPTELPPTAAFDRATNGRAANGQATADGRLTNGHARNGQAAADGGATNGRAANGQATADGRAATNGRSMNGEARQDLERLRRFRQLLEIHHLKHWPVKRYARELGLSESSLNRLCSNLGGSTAFGVVQQRLVLEARRRLVYVAGPVAMIASELGFKDPAYFCRFFRRHTGVSPTEFRRRQHDG